MMNPLTAGDIKKIVVADDIPGITITASPYDPSFSGIVDGAGGGGGGTANDQKYIIGKIGLQK